MEYTEILKRGILGKRIVVGLSGGVDSAVAAYLLKEQGAIVTGMTMMHCDGMEEAILDAKRIADYLNIEHVICDERLRFKREVLEYFAGEYSAGRTPNPCVKCNRCVKWAALMDTMRKTGASYIATGHYAIPVAVSDYGTDSASGGAACTRYSLLKNNGPKDQTYALSMLTQEELLCTLMPLAGLNKKEVRDIADKAGLPVATKPDSQDICFVRDGNYAGVIGNGICLDAAGDFVDEEGNVLGRHKGIIHYTIGQRKGLGLSLNKPAYVRELRTDTNEVVISVTGDVYGRELICTDLNPVAAPEFRDKERLTAKIRYAGTPEECTVYRLGDDALRVVFDRPVRAITPGQICVFYKDDILYGGAVIQKDASL